MDLPDDWEDQTVFTFKGPEENGIQHNLVLIVDNDPDNISLQDYARLRLDSIKETLPGFELMGDQEKIMKSGLNAYEIIYKWSPSDDKIIFQKQVYIIMNNKAYNFTASFSKKTIKTIGIKVDEIIDSFTPQGD